MLLSGLSAHFSAEQIAALAQTRVGIAGLGGIGSNVAMLLARSGIGELLLIDCDVVEASNLNRQQYWPQQLGKLKTLALAENLLAINDKLRLESLNIHLDAKNLPEIIARCPIWTEALDQPAEKREFVESALRAGSFVVAASGIGGIGGESLRKISLGRLIVAGDFRSAHAPGMPVLAPRVLQAAAIMADSILEYVLGAIQA